MPGRQGDATMPGRQDEAETATTYSTLLRTLDAKIKQAAVNHPWPLHCIPVRGDRVRVVDEPAAFYEEIRVLHDA